jgi:hypothetical protein
MLENGGGGATCLFRRVPVQKLRGWHCCQNVSESGGRRTGLLIPHSGQKLTLQDSCRSIRRLICLLCLCLFKSFKAGTPARTCWERAGSAVSAFWQKADPVRFLQIQPEIDAYIGGFWSGEIFLDPGREFYKARTPFVY